MFAGRGRAVGPKTLEELVNVDSPVIVVIVIVVVVVVVVIAIIVVIATLVVFPTAGVARSRTWAGSSICRVCSHGLVGGRETRHWQARSERGRARNCRN